MTDYFLVLLYLVVFAFRINRNSIIALIAFYFTFAYTLSPQWDSHPAWLNHFIYALPYVGLPVILKFDIRVSMLILILGVLNWLFMLYYLTPFAMAHDTVAFLILSFALNLAIIFTVYKAKNNGRVRHSRTDSDGHNDLWRIPTFTKQNQRGTFL